MTGVTVVHREIRRFVVDWDADEEPAGREPQASPERSAESLEAAIIRSVSDTTDRPDACAEETRRRDWLIGEPSF